MKVLRSQYDSVFGKLGSGHRTGNGGQFSFQSQRRAMPKNVQKYHTVALISHASRGFPGGSEVKASACSAGDLGSVPGLGRSPGEGNCNPLQYSFLENSMDRGALYAIVHGVAKSRPRLSNFTSYASKVMLKILLSQASTVHEPRTSRCSS